MDITQIIVATVGGIAVIFAASIPSYFTYKTHKSTSKVAESVGKANGHGSIQEQFDLLWKMGELDRQDRGIGRERQTRIEQNQAKFATSIEEMAITAKANQSLINETINQLQHHSEEDMVVFKELREQSESLYRVVAKLMATLGNPADWAEDGTTLIEYLRTWHHDQLNKENVWKMLDGTQRELLEKAISILSEYDQAIKDRLAEGAIGDTKT